jgi:hypothetical protein
VIVKGTLWPFGIVTGKESPPTVNTPESLVLAAVTVTLAPLALRVPEAVLLFPTATLPRSRVAGVMLSVGETVWTG